jgi:hypothetical protein
MPERPGNCHGKTVGCQRIPCADLQRARMGGRPALAPSLAGQLQTGSLRSRVLSLEGVRSSHEAAGIGIAVTGVAGAVSIDHEPVAWFLEVSADPFI